jgi:beta-N-acetylhexosaminidase
MLSGIEILVFDIQGVGARFYTYAATMLECMKAAADSEVPFVILDRPNPINGNQVEGPVLEAGMESFIGIARLPIRHGMTPGEMAFFLKSVSKLDLDLRVVPLSGWHRAQWFDETGLTWIAPSPNMPTLETATVYPGLCLVEGTNLSEGRGTTLPFELIGAPWLDSRSLARQLNQLALAGVRFRPQAFTPRFSKYTGQLCSGIQIHVLERREFRPIQTALHILHQTRLLHPCRFEFDETFFDQLAGNHWIREMLQNGVPVDSIVDRWRADLEEFKQERKKFLLY